MQYMFLWIASVAWLCYHPIRTLIRVWRPSASAASRGLAGMLWRIIGAEGYGHDDFDVPAAKSHHAAN